jgi:hypothetical protein
MKLPQVNLRDLRFATTSYGVFRGEKFYHMRKATFYDFSKTTIEKTSGKIKAISEVSRPAACALVVIYGRMI